MAYPRVTPFAAYRAAFLKPLVACVLSQCLVFALHMLNGIEVFDALVIFYPFAFAMATVFLYAGQHTPWLVWSLFLASLHMDMLYMHAIGISASTSYVVMRLVNRHGAWVWWSVAALSVLVGLIVLLADQMIMRICLWFLNY